MVNEAKLGEKLTMVINTYHGFSDLWSGHVQLLNQNWCNRDIRTVLLTDEETEESFTDVEVVAAGKNLELPQRLEYFLPSIKTEYVLLTLDDYYPIYPISNDRIEKLIEAMDSLQIDYLRLFNLPRSRKKINGYDNLFQIDLNSKKDQYYQVNLYAGIWRKRFLEFAVRQSNDIWGFELTLTQIAREHNMRCVLSTGKEFETLDVVRKGCLLHKAKKFFDQNPGIYCGERPVASRKKELSIDLMTFLKCHLSQRTINVLKRAGRQFGMSFYSDRVEHNNENSSD